MAPAFDDRKLTIIGHRSANQELVNAEFGREISQNRSFGMRGTSPISQIQRSGGGDWGGGGGSCQSEISSEARHILHSTTARPHMYNASLKIHAGKGDNVTIF
jgi:hypothetical protein